MKILQVINNLDAEGAQNLLVDLCLQWKRSGISPEVFVLHDGDRANQARLEDAGISVTVSSQPLYSPGCVKELSGIIAHGQFDLVHVHLFPAQLWTAMALRSVRGAPPGLTTEHSTWNRRRNYRLCQAVDRWIYSQFRLTICIGSAVQASLDAWLGQGICPTCVVDNGVDLTRFHRSCAGPSDTEEVPGRRTILCVGRFTELKGQETLIRALAHVDGVRVLLAGDGPLKPRLEQVARQSGVADRVHFLGVRHDIPDLIATADIYVQPSKVDGFCLAALEAMAGGLPVIASDIPGLRELVGECAVRFPAGDHLRLAECIRALLQNSALTTDLAARAINRAQQFSIENTAAQYRAIFENAGR